MKYNEIYDVSPFIKAIHVIRKIRGTAAAEPPIFTSLQQKPWGSSA